MVVAATFVVYAFASVLNFPTEWSEADGSLIVTNQRAQDRDERLLATTVDLRRFSTQRGWLADDAGTGATRGCREPHRRTRRAAAVRHRRGSGIPCCDRTPYPRLGEIALQFRRRPTWYHGVALEVRPRPRRCRHLRPFFTSGRNSIARREGRGRSMSGDPLSSTTHRYPQITVTDVAGASVLRAGPDRQGANAAASLPPGRVTVFTETV